MSIQTNPDLRRSVIYELYVRSHTPQGTFRAVEPDLPRIRALGTARRTARAPWAAPTPTGTIAP